MANHSLRVEQIKFLFIVEDMDRALGFYHALFGLEVATRSPRGSELTLGEVMIALHGGGGQGRKTGLSFQVGGIDAACERSVESGRTVISAPESRPGEPIKLARVQDTEGNTFDITKNVGE